MTKNLQSRWILVITASSCNPIPPLTLCSVTLSNFRDAIYCGLVGVDFDVKQTNHKRKRVLGFAHCIDEQFPRKKRRRCQKWIESYIDREQSVPVAGGLWLLRAGVSAGLITPLDVPRHIGIRVAPPRSLVWQFVLSGFVCSGGQHLVQLFLSLSLCGIITDC